MSEEPKIEISEFVPAKDAAVTPAATSPEARANAPVARNEFGVPCIQTEFNDLPHYQRKYLSPFRDVTFKKIFAQEETNDLLLDFINAVLPLEWHVKTVKLVRAEREPYIHESRALIFDILCVGDNGETFIVEMQRAYQDWFIDRSIFSLANVICAQIKRGENQIKLKPTFFIALLDFTLDDPKLTNDPVQEITLKNQHGHEVYKKMRIFFLQLPLFPQEVDKLKSRLDEWVISLEMLDKGWPVPEPLARDPLLKKLSDTLAVASMNEAEMRAFQRELTNIRDHNAYVLTAENKGRREGIAEGITIGKEEGAKKEKLATVRRLKELGLPAEAIAKGVELSVAEVEQMLRQT
jgi:predicted transposase/invertase (TIGR01784 family)